MSDSMSAVSWYVASKAHVRLFMANEGRITELAFDRRWRRGPLCEAGTSVAATACVDASGELHLRAFIGNGVTISEHRWHDGEWKPGPLFVKGIAAAATSFIAGTNQLIMRVYVRHAAVHVTEYCWDGGRSWYRGVELPVWAVEHGLAAVSWTEGSAGNDWYLRVYSSNDTGVRERKWHYGWSDGADVFNGRNVAATSWHREPNKPEIATYVREGNEVIEKWSNGGAWLDGQFPRVPGISATATSWFDGKVHIRTFVRDEFGEIFEHRFDDGTGWTRGATVFVSPATPWRLVSDKLHRGTQPFVIKGMCYSRTLIGEPVDQPAPSDSIHAEESVWRADLDAMREMGVNTIRIYGMTIGREGYETFLRHAWNGGDRPIYLLLSLWIEPLLLGLRTSSSEPAMPRQLELWRTGKSPTANPNEALTNLRNEYFRLVRTYASHPAVMGFSIGAEVNNTNTMQDGNGFESLGHLPEFWDDFLSIAAAIRGAASGRILTTGLIDGTQDAKWSAELNNMLYTDIEGESFGPISGIRTVPAGLRLGLQAEKRRAGSEPLIDLWGIDIYKEPAEFPPLFQRYRDAFTKLGRPFRPLLVAEFGRDVPQDDATNGKAQSVYLKAVWEKIAAAPGIVCGGCIFEWADEWWKVVGQPKDQQNGKEERFGINALTNTPSDRGRTLLPRVAYGEFQTLWR